MCRWKWRLIQADYFAKFRTAPLPLSRKGALPSYRAAMKPDKSARGCPWFITTNHSMLLLHHGGLTHVIQCFFNVLGGYVSMVCLGVLNGFLQMFHRLGHMLVLFCVLFFGSLGVLQAFFGVLEQYLCMAVFPMPLGHSAMFHRLSGVMFGRDG